MKTDIIHEAWHQTNRSEAEDLLKDQTEGTFLFRKDEYASILEEELKEHYQNDDFKCFTVTFVEKEEKITDRTLVFTEGKWMIYNDDPSLEGQSYTNITDLIDSMSDRLKYPLLN